MKKYITSGVSLMLLCFLFSGLAHAAQGEIAGKVLIKVGNVSAVRGDLPVRGLKNGSPIYVGDVIKTKSDSKVQLQFRDFTIISLGPKAKMTIDAFLFEEGNKNSKCETSIVEGAFKIVGGKISKMAPDQIKIKTPCATIGIRGTMGCGLVEAEQTTTVYMGGGAISVRGVALGDNTGSSSPTGPGGPGDLGLVILTGTPGMGTITGMGQQPPAPYMFSPSEIFYLMNATNVFGSDEEGPVGSYEDGDDDDDDGGGIPGLPTPPRQPFNLGLLNLGDDDDDNDLIARGLGLLINSTEGEVDYDVWAEDIENVTSNSGFLNSPGDYLGAWNYFENYPTTPISAGTYDNQPLTWLFTDTLVFDGEELDVGVILNFDNLGEFAFMNRFSLDQQLRWGLGESIVRKTFYEMIYAGAPSNSIPHNKVLRYGPIGTFSENLGISLLVSEQDNDYYTADVGTVGFGVNTLNKRFIMVVDDDGQDLTSNSHFGFGSVNDSGELSGKVFSQEEQDIIYDIDSFDASYHYGDLTGQLFGSQHQGIGTYGSGGSSSTGHEEDASSWEVITAAFLDSDKTTEAEPGVIIHNSGFVAGVALDGSHNNFDGDDDDDYSQAPTFWLNSDSEDVYLTLNDSNVNGAMGLVHGGFNAEEYDQTGNLTENTMAIIVGDDNSEDNSAYVTPDLFVGLVTGGVVDNATLQTDGSYIVAYPLAELEDKPWITMGGLSVHYIDEAGHERVMPRVLSYFVSGIKSEIDDAMYASMRSGNVTGHYKGSAFGTYISNGFASNLSGQSDFDINFNSESYAGSIQMGAHNLASSGAINKDGFGGPITNWTISGAAQNVVNSELNGGFYGGVPAGEAPASIGGNLIATHNTGAGGTMTAIFDGHNTPAAD